VLSLAFLFAGISGFISTRHNIFPLVAFFIFSTKYADLRVLLNGFYQLRSSCENLHLFVAICGLGQNQVPRSCKKPTEYANCICQNLNNRELMFKITPQKWPFSSY
jgi:hypothetical protein